MTEHPITGPALSAEDLFGATCLRQVTAYRALGHPASTNDDRPALQEHAWPCPAQDPFILTDMTLSWATEGSRSAPQGAPELGRFMGLAGRVGGEEGVFRDSGQTDIRGWLPHDRCSSGAFRLSRIERHQELSRDIVGSGLLAAHSRTRGSPRVAL